MFDISFDQVEPQVICHSQYQALIPRLLNELKAYDLTNHFILFSSGTTGGDLKGYAVSKEALLANAKAVNKHFGLTKNDVWGLSLPIYHIGGLSILARAHLLGNKVVDGRNWNPDEWKVKMNDVTITAIVPTQLFDLIQKKTVPPQKLKYLIVGGDYLNSGLRDEAKKIGWPVIKTFGMSEICSQLASMQMPFKDDLKILPIHQIRIDEGKLLVKSDALFTLEFKMGEKFEVTMAKNLCTDDGYYITKDMAEFQSGNFKHLGRVGDEFKVSGHLVNLLQLRNTLSNFLLRKNLFNQIEIVAEDDDRKGKKLIIQSLVQMENDLQDEITALFSPAKIDEFKLVQSFERTSLGKLKKINS